MMPTARSVLPFGSCLTALALVLTFSRAAHVDECVTDTDCGHGERHGRRSERWHGKQ